VRLTRGQLTERERLFVTHYAAIGDARFAAEKAGYANISTAGIIPDRPRVSAALERARERLRDVGGPIGVETLIKLCGEKYPPGTRRAAASDLIKFAGIAAIDEALHKEDYERTAAELEQRRQQLMRELSDLAIPIVELEAEQVESAQPTPQDDAELGVFG